jgi:hypothetical protein
MTHAFNVTHVMYWIICCGPNESYLKTKAFTDLDKLAMLIACIGHDLNHPGLGNTYFQKSNHVLSQVVNGRSVLEHFHCYTLFQILNKTQLLSSLPPKDI